MNTINNNFTIKKISWDRIWISFEINDLPEDSEVYLFHIPNRGNASKRVDEKSIYKLPHDKITSSYKLNITNPGNCQMLPTGIYELYTTYGNDNKRNPITIYSPVKEGTEQSLASLKRQFVYFHSERAYRVQFSDRNGFKIKTSDVRLKNQSLVQRISSLVRRFRNNTAKQILRTIYEMEYMIFHKNKSLSKDTRDIQSIKNPYILLMSDQSEEMGSNMSAFKKALLKNGYRPQEALRAVTTKHYSILHWIKTLKKIASADFIFLDDHSQTTDWLTIKGAIITQLWHAGAGFKSTGYSRFGMPASPAPKSGHRQYTYGIAGSKKIRHFFSEVWGINDEMVLPTGMPRLDEYLNPTHIATTKNNMLNSYKVLCKPQTSQKRDNIILFAPTYRGENKRTAYYPYDRLDFQKLYSYCEETDSVIIFKMHPFVMEPVPIPDEYKDRMLDLTAYSNINDLFYLTDLLITDYSSNIYEFSLMRRPMLFYAFDIDEYSKERGFHRDYRENVPGKIVENFDEMISALKNKDFEYKKVGEYISNNFDHVDTHACDRIIDWIIKGNI